MFRTFTFFLSSIARGLFSHCDYLPKSTLEFVNCGRQHIVSSVSRRRTVGRSLFSMLGLVLRVREHGARCSPGHATPGNMLL